MNANCCNNKTLVHTSRNHHRKTPETCPSLSSFAVLLLRSIYPWQQSGTLQKIPIQTHDFGPVLGAKKLLTRSIFCSVPQNPTHTMQRGLQFLTLLLTLALAYLFLEKLIHENRVAWKAVLAACLWSRLMCATAVHHTVTLKDLN